MTEHNVCRFRIRLGSPEVTSNTPATAVAVRTGRPSPLMGRYATERYSDDYAPPEPGQPTHQWLRLLDIPENPFRAASLVATARAHAAELFAVEQVQLSRILIPSQFAAAKAASATGPILLTILRQQRRIEDGPGAGSWPDHRTPGNALYLPDDEAAAGAVKDALAKSQTSIAARILEVFV